MHIPEFNPPPFAITAVMQLLVRHGGAMRINALHASSALSVDDLCATLNELQWRSWVKITWRLRPRRDGPERLRRAERVTATRFGRSRMLPDTSSAGRPRRRRARRRAASLGY